MPETLTPSWTGPAGTRSHFARYQALLAAPAWPAACLAPDLDGSALPDHDPGHLPGVAALVACGAGWPAATIAPDLD